MSSALKSTVAVAGLLPFRAYWIANAAFLEQLDAEALNRIDHGAGRTHREDTAEDGRW